MKESQNTDYKKVLSTAVMVTATLFLPNQVTASVTEEQSIFYNKPSYDQYVNYESTQQSTYSYAGIQNDIPMLKQMEISKLNDKISSIFHTKIIEHWIPADGLLEKTCLFIKVHNQEEFISKIDDFELDLYLNLKEELNSNKFFNMIALL
jgi:hypothetical protein